MKNKVIGPGDYNNLLDRIANILVEARTKVVREINKAQYWHTGKLVEKLLNLNKKAGQGQSMERN